jgi:HSP20 family protein
MMLMRTDPFRDLDRWTQQVLGTAARPAVMPLDAWREGDEFIVEFDLPGVSEDSLNLDVERNVLTVHACSAASCFWARLSMPTRSRPATTTGCCG